MHTMILFKTAYKHLQTGAYQYSTEFLTLSNWNAALNCKDASHTPAANQLLNSSCKCKRDNLSVQTWLFYTTFKICIFFE